MPRSYRSESLTVFWDPARCIHTAICLRTLPEVFDTGKRPWITIGGADTDAIVAAVEACPSGALTYERVDGSGETGERPVTITVRPNGPLAVRGDVRVEDADGVVFATGPRATLCRCGNTRNAPFCDLSHRRVGFIENTRAVSSERTAAESPAAVTWSDDED